MKVSSRRGLALGAMAALMISTIAQAAETTVADGKLTFSGYADMRYTNVTIEDQAGVLGNPQSGFGIEDGAFYSTFTKGQMTLVLDVPFRKQKLSDDDAGTTAQADGNDIVFGQDKTQVYAKWAFNDQLSLSIGQWDTFFGVEVNDSKDRVFMKTGIVYDNMIPVTHTGALVTWANNGLTGRVFAANKADQGSYGDNTSTDQNGEYGASLGWANDMWRAQFAYKTGAERKVGFGAHETDDATLMDVTVGMTMNNLNVDIEYASLKSPNKNTLTAVGNDSEDDGTGLLGLVSYKFNDDLTLGVRYEMIDNDPGKVDKYKEATAYGVAVHYNMAANMQFRAEYDAIDYSDDALTSTTGTGMQKDWSDKRFILGALASF